MADTVWCANNRPLRDQLIASLALKGIDVQRYASLIREHLPQLQLEHGDNLTTIATAITLLICQDIKRQTDETTAETERYKSELMKIRSRLEALSVPTSAVVTSNDSLSATELTRLNLSSGVTAGGRINMPNQNVRVTTSISAHNRAAPSVDYNNSIFAAADNIRRTDYLEVAANRPIIIYYDVNSFETANTLVELLRGCNLGDKYHLVDSATTICDKISAMVEKYSKAPPMPVIIINGKCIGSRAEFMNLYTTNQLSAGVRGEPGALSTLATSVEVLFINWLSAQQQRTLIFYHTEFKRYRADRGFRATHTYDSVERIRVQDKVDDLATIVITYVGGVVEYYRADVQKIDKIIDFISRPAIVGW